MGYESRIYIGRRRQLLKQSKSGKENWFDLIAVIDLCKMGYDNHFTEVFKTPIDFDVYTHPDQEPTGRDSYGDPMKYCTAEDLFVWYAEEGYKMRYDRVDLLYSIVLHCMQCGPDDMVFVHYGY